MVETTPFLEIITIGREILDGRVIDTNSVWMAQKLRQRGLIVRHAQKVDDDLGRIEQAFHVASRRSNYIIVTGGLGPTSDDRTAEAFALFQHDSLELNKEAEECVRSYLRQKKKEVTLAQLKQAYLPSKVGVIPNANGTAPAFYFKERTRLWFFLPGVPREMTSLFESHVMPMLPVDEGYRSYQWITQFTSESKLQELLSNIEQSLPLAFELGFRTRFPENHISLFASCNTENEVELYNGFRDEITKVLSTSCFSHGEAPIGVEDCILEVAEERGTHLAFVESCTGGLNSHRITEVPGSSGVLKASWVVYDNLAKIKLGVSESTLAKHGAVSKECAESMAKAGLDKLREMFPNEECACVSTTGIAGPGGATENKPVGLCYAAVSFMEKDSDEVKAEVIKIEAGIDYERSKNKLYFSQKSLIFLFDYLSAP
ncbi:nicotinamide-nucleotide amidohydrolase family protein [bacterium]|nr:nicotinamide-nucleotide amidohydrolase family protein [bacterium]